MMSRQPAQRNLTLTEELEKLEQSITLTLQEIDSNFSKAHRIVTTGILPIVEDYARHSNDVWEGSKFWKQFFEASANVSLSGYEEAALEEDPSTTLDTTSTQLQTPTEHEEKEPTKNHTGQQHLGEEDDSFTVDSPTQVTGVNSTPKLQPSTQKGANGTSRYASSSYRSPSPRKYTGKNPRAIEPASEEPSTPQAQADFKLASSPFEPESAYQASTAKRSGAAPRSQHDPLLHRGVLDKNYRIQATPHTQRKQRASKTKPSAATPATTTTTRTRALWEDSPSSSPAVEAPQLRSDLFSPHKGPSGPRTPGVSILTPGRRAGGNTTAGAGAGAITTSTGRQLFTKADKTYTPARASHVFSQADSDYDSDDDDEFDIDISPPKTMQFHVPQSRLLQTPAREASRRIVEDLLLTAGADATDEIEGEEDEQVEEPSPSVVRKAWSADDSTF